MSKLAVALGETVRRERKKRGLSQEALAAIASLNRTYVSEIERGLTEASARNLQRIAQALNLRLSELVRLSESHND